MKARKRTPQPLNFTPDEPSPRELAARAAAQERAEARSRAGPQPLPRGGRAPPVVEPAAAAANSPPLGLSRNTAAGAPDLGIARYAYPVAGIAAVAWAGMLGAYTIGYVGGVQVLARTPLQLTLLLVFAVLPGLFVFAAAFAVRQGARLGAEARWARTLAEDLTTPMALAAARTGDVVAAVREEIERAAAAAASAHDQLTAVREALAMETDRLTEAAGEAQRTARVVGETLARERDEVAALVAQLNGQVEGISQGVERQARLVGEASDLASSQLHEAEASLAASAANLATAGADAGAAARDAGDALAHQAERLDVAAAALSERLRFLDARLTDQRSALSNLAATVDQDQEDLAIRLEGHRAQLQEAIAQAHGEIADLDHISLRGADALRGLIANASDQVEHLAAAARGEQQALASHAADVRLEAEEELRRAIAGLAAAGETARAAVAGQAQEAQETSAAHVAAARAQVEQLGELAFAAGQRANQAFDSRIAEARRMIEQTAALVEDAGARSAERIEDRLGATRTALGELTGALGDIDAQMTRLPDTARRQVEGLRASVEQGIGELTAAARRAAEETQAIDATFQERIRRNYEALSEAVRLMGKVAGSVERSRAAAPAAAPVPVPPAHPAPAPVEPALGSANIAPAAREPEAPVGRPAPAADRAPIGTPSRPAADPPGFWQVTRPERAAEATRPPASEPAADLTFAEALGDPAPTPPDGLRPRLKLTPTVADQALRAVFDPTGRPAPEALGPRTNGRDRPVGEPDEWTWKDLLKTVEEPAADLDTLAEHMVREIVQLGVDSAALLPASRVAEMAEVLVSGDAPAARDMVRRLAPAAIRRLSRRVLTDRALREQTDRYVARYEGLLQGEALRTGGPRAAAGLLGSDAGRAFLLLDAAVGDL